MPYLSYVSHPLPPHQIEDILQTLQSLPADRQRQVVEFIEFVAARSAAEREEDWFWGLVGLIDLERGDTEGATNTLIDTLSQLEDEEIFKFHDLLAEKLSALDGPLYFEHSVGSADGFLYERAYAVGSGKKQYYAVLENPGLFPEDNELQYLLSVAESAYERKHGRDLERVPKVIYESFWNQALWGEEAIAIHA